MSTDDHSHVLVGYDGSPGSEQALRWAVREARMRYLPLVVSNAYEWPVPSRPTSANAFASIMGAADAVAREGVGLATALGPRLKVGSRIVRGGAAPVLLGQSTNAEIVVGSRGTGGSEDPRVDSMPLQVCAHGTRPTVVSAPRRAVPTDSPPSARPPRPSTRRTPWSADSETTDGPPRG